jgi:hypothetical protein
MTRYYLFLVNPLYLSSMVKYPIDEIIKKLEDLQLQTEQTLEELRALNRSEEQGVPSTTTANFQVGDQVLITNRINHARRGAPGTDDDRVGIVTSVTEHRVFLRTLAGTHTCRARKNLRLIGVYF